MANSDPTPRLIELGMSSRDAKRLIRTLRDDVGRMSNYLLPDVAYSAAPGPLLGGQRVVAEVVTETAREMMVGETMALMTPEMRAKLQGFSVPRSHARYAALPVIALDPAAVEWIRHASRRRLGIELTSRPEPDWGLRRYRDDYEQRNPVAATFTGRVSAVYYQALAVGYPGQASRSIAVEWTGWALLAVMMALNTHVYHLGEYALGPDEHWASTAYRNGIELLTGAAINLVNEAEREAA
jgi:hypothetical protein